jgi:hypothetical protein
MIHGFSLPIMWKIGKDALCFLRIVALDLKESSFSSQYDRQ